MDEKRSEKNEALSLDDSRRFSTKSEKSCKGDEESIQQDEKLPYPTHVFFIFGNEFCERFAFYGMKTVLSLYLTTKLLFSEGTATRIASAFTSLCYFMSIPGAILSDSYLGKFKTILYVSIVYACGSILLSIGALHIKGDVPISLIALFVIACGTGGIKPCVSAFGGDQFKLPQQAPQMETFFAIFYFSINLGSFISTILTPILRSDVSCFGDETCFFAAFGIPAILFVIAIVVFVIGLPRYTIVPPTGENLLVKSCKCIGNALIQKRKLKKAGDMRDHWLDYAEEAYGATFVDDVKAVLNVIVLYIPLVLYWTLYDQPGTVWTFQCTNMNGKLGGITLKPDQMQAVNAILILIFIPVFDRVVYPVAAKMNCLVNPLNRVAWGGVVLAVAFVVAGIVELFVEKTYPELPEGDHAHISIVNGVGCDVYVQSNDLNNGHEFSVSSFSEKTFKEIDAKTVTFSLAVNVSTCEGEIVPENMDIDEYAFDTGKGKSASIFMYVHADSKDFKIKQMDNDDKVKDREGNAKTRVFYNLPTSVLEDYHDIFFDCHEKRGDTTYKIDSDETGNTDYNTLEPYEYTIYLQDGSDQITSEDEPSFEMGGVYNVLIQQMDDENGMLRVNVIEITTPNSYHMLLQVPQYAVLTAGEMLFSITGLQFSYNQAPPSMKCVVQSCWLLTTAFGDIIFIFLSMIELSSNAYESFMFAGIMIADVLFFAFLAYRYKPYKSKITKKVDKTEDEGFAE